MTYKLLKFCQDYADEFNVVALECFTQENFDKWCNKPMGKINENYDIELEEFNKAKEAYNTFIVEIRKRNLHNKRVDTFTPEEKEWYDKNRKPYVLDYHAPIRVISNLNAYLGNYSDGFSKTYDNLETGYDFIKAGIVEVFDVDASFYNQFHKSNLSEISLCNVFDIDDLTDSEEDEND